MLEASNLHPTTPTTHILSPDIPQKTSPISSRPVHVAPSDQSEASACGLCVIGENVIVLQTFISLIVKSPDKYSWIETGWFARRVKCLYIQVFVLVNVTDAYSKTN